MEDFSQMLTPDAVVIYPSRGKLLLVALGAGAFVALGLLAWRTGEITGQIEGRVVAVLGVGFFGVCLAYALVRLIWRTPSLIINHLGMFDGSSALGGYTLRWEEIEGIYISAIKVSALSRQRFLSIRLRNADEFFRRISPAKAKAMRMSISLVGAPVNISATALSGSLEDLIQLIRQKCPDILVID